ncbi:DsrE family protein [bacterium]|nr:DsrE family protein [bacterium]
MNKSNNLIVLWTSGDKEVAQKMVFMYVYNSKALFNLWKDITLIIWGPSAKLLAEDKELQDYIKKIKATGVKLKACQSCADEYGVSDKLEAMGIEVTYMAQELTDYIKAEYHLVTF